MIWQMEEATLFVLLPFFIKHWLLKVGKSGGKVHPEVSGGIAAIGERKVECTNSNLFDFPSSCKAEDVTYHLNHKST
jgi:hypothetical protein